MSANRDLIVTLDISRAPILDSDEQEIQNPRLSYWPHGLLQDMPEAEFGRPFIVVHSTEHPGRLPVAAPEASLNGKPKNWRSALPNRKAFCGWDKPVSLLRLELSPEQLRALHPALVSENDGLPVPHVFHAGDPRILEMSDWLQEELHSNSIDGKEYAHALANTLVLHILRYYAASPAIPGSFQMPRAVSPEVERAIEYMHTFLARPISLADLSQAAQVSPSHLARLFKRSTGLSPHQFLIRLRVDHARRMLQSEMRSISDVATRSGFADQSHLNRHLKRIYGVTPKTILDSK